MKQDKPFKVFYGSTNHIIKPCPNCNQNNLIYAQDDDCNNEYFKCWNCKTKYTGTFYDKKRIKVNPFIIKDKKAVICLDEEYSCIIGTKCKIEKNENILAKGDYKGVYSKEGENMNTYTCYNFSDIYKNNLKIGVAKCPKCNQDVLSRKIIECGSPLAVNKYHCECGEEFIEKRYGYNIRGKEKYNSELRNIIKVKSIKTGKKYLAVRKEIGIFFIIINKNEYAKVEEEKFQELKDKNF